MLLRVLRKEAKLSQEALASQVGCNRDTIRRWEKGACEPTLTQAQRVADALGVNLSELAQRRTENPTAAPASRRRMSGASTPSAV